MLRIVYNDWQPDSDLGFRSPDSVASADALISVVDRTGDDVMTVKRSFMISAAALLLLVISPIRAAEQDTAGADVDDGILPPYGACSRAAGRCALGVELGLEHEDALMPSEKFCRQGRHARKSAGRSR